MSFKNYLYQTVKFEMFKRMKTDFNWQVIPHYSAQKKMIIETFEYEDIERDYLNDLYLKEEMQKIVTYLNKNKKAEYAEIWRLKCSGFKNAEIAIKLKMTADEVKSKFQYIKKIILKKFKNTDSE